MLRLITQREAAEALSLSGRSLERMRCQGGGPKFVRLSRGRIAYREADLEEWIAKRVVSSTSEPMETNR
jgi:predicted DNA-binding transcriptional regulator AlpA